MSLNMFTSQKKEVVTHTHTFIVKIFETDANTMAGQNFGGPGVENISTYILHKR